MPLDKTWELLADFSNVQKIHPLVGKVDQQTPQDGGVGAVRQCHLYDGNRAVERIEEWNETARSYKIVLIDGTLPMKKVEVVVKAEDAGNGKSTLIAEMVLMAKYGLLGKLMEHLVIKPQLGGAIGDLFAGLESYGKTGIEIEKGFKAKTKAIAC